MGVYLDRAQRKLGQAGRKSERKVSKALGADLTPASGAGMSKGDMRLGELMVEAKSTIHDTLRVELEWLLKVKREALASGQTPALALSFTHSDGTPRETWVALPQWAFKMLLEE